MPRSRALLTWLVVLIFAGGCVCCCGNIIPPLGPNPELVQEDIVGTWRSADGAEVTFEAAGTFSANGLDKCEDSDGEGGPDTGTGTWVLHEGSFMNPAQRLELDWDTDTENRDWLADDEHVFFGPIGDPDLWHFCFFSLAKKHRAFT